MLGGDDFQIGCGEDVNVTTDDFSLEQEARSQQRKTERRQRERLKRKKLVFLASIASLLGVLFFLPSMISQSGIGRNYLVTFLGSKGLQADVGSLRIGWLTPLRVKDLKINGETGSQLAVEQLDVNLTVSDLWGLPENLGKIQLRGVAVACSMSEGQCSLEHDFATLLKSDTEQATSVAELQLQDVAISVTKSTTSECWTLTQSNVVVSIMPDSTEVSVAGVLSEPEGNHGSMQSSIQLATASADQDDIHWSLTLNCESLPISVAELLLTRFPEMATGIPGTIRGDATGIISAAGKSNGDVSADLQNFDIRNLVASRHGDPVWQNARASLNGQLLIEGNQLIGKSLSAHTDFASATIDGSFARSFSWTGTENNPIQWLEAIDGSASAEIDIAAMERALPGLLPIRSDVSIESGRAVAHLVSIPNGNLQQKKLHIDCDNIRAVSAGRKFSIDPITLSATVSSKNSQLTADHFEWRSAFGSAIGSGDLEKGNADFNIDFGQLNEMLSPIFDMTETRFSGNANGHVEWTSGNRNLWRLVGTGQTTNLLVQLPGGRTLRRNAMQASIEALGRWQNGGIRELTQTHMAISSRGLNIDATLDGSVDGLSRNVKLPFNIQTNGRLETVEGILKPWMPQKLDQLSGEFSGDFRASIGLNQATVTSGAIELTEPGLYYNAREFQQPLVKIQFDGNYNWPANTVQARSMTLVGNAFSFAAQGTANPDDLNVQVKYRAKLDRLQQSFGQQLTANDVANPGINIAPQFPASDPWMVLGDCEGSLSLRSDESDLLIEFNTIGQNIACVQPASQHASLQTVGPQRENVAAIRPEATIVWHEPNLTLDVQLRHQGSSNTLIAEQVNIAGDWFAASLSGEVTEVTNSIALHLAGASRVKMTEVAKRVSKLAKMDITAKGVHKTDLTLDIIGQIDGGLGFSLQTDLGLESGQIAGMELGKTTVPIVLTETSLDVQQARIPLNGGNLECKAQLHYRPGPVWMHIEPGATARSIQLTPEMTNRWLKYVAPLIANATKIQGTLGAELDETAIVFDHPERTQGSGRINISSAEMSAGPLASQIIEGISNLASVANGLSPQPGPRFGTTNLVTMPPQTVDFSVQNGIISHERLYLNLDRAQVITSGQVGFDGSLNMTAQVPLDARWLGRDLRQLAGQVVTLPIDGTISRPSLDSNGMRRIATQLGTEAIQTTAENYLQEQLNKGLNKIFRW